MQLTSTMLKLLQQTLTDPSQVISWCKKLFTDQPTANYNGFLIYCNALKSETKNRQD